MVTTLYIVRHCQSAGNLDGRFQGRYDSEVSPAGRRQLDLLALRFRNVKLDAIYASPLQRAYETALAVAQFHHVPVRKMDGLLELDVGKMENLKLSEIGELYPDVAVNWDRAPDLCEFPGGETMREAYVRINAAIDEIVAENGGKTVFIATHGGVIRNLYARVCFGCPEGMRDSGAIFGNTGVSILEAEDGKLSWKLLNDQSHLPEELRRPPTVYTFHSEAL